jgi:PEP-CTERM motif
MGGVCGWDVEIANGVGPERTLLLNTDLPGCCDYPNPDIAFQDGALGGLFSLTAPQTVYAGVNDSYSGDNTGGISILIASVPEPSTWAMMLFGFGGFGLVAFRRARNDRRAVTIA